jgi:predicted Zn-dependent peptidase
MPDVTLRRSELPSGTRILTEQVPGVRSVSLGVWIDAGSRDEGDEEVGLTHFIEHMLFKGTPALDARGIAEAFDHIGADVNAMTGKEHTSVYTRVMSKYLKEAVSIILDMVQHSVFDPDEIDSERKVILEEIAMHMDSPDELVHDELALAMWGEHPIAHMVLGESDVINRADRDFLQAFQGRRYVGSRMVVSAAGDIDHDQLLDIVSVDAVDMDTGGPSDRSGSMENPLTGSRFYTKETEQAHICMGSGGLRRNHPDRFSLAVMDNMLGGSMSSRLFQSIREAKGLAYSIYSYNGLFIGMGMVGIYCGTHPSQAQQVIEMIEEELVKVRADGYFTEEEIIRAKNHIEGSLFISMEDSGNRMNRIAKTEMSGGEQLSVEEMVERVHGVTAEDIAHVFEETWGGTPLSLAIVGPFEDGSLSLAGDF